MSRDKLTDALDGHKSALVIAERLAKADPSNAERLVHLAKCHANIATVLAEQGERMRAIEGFEQAEEVLRPLLFRETDIESNIKLVKDIGGFIGNIMYLIEEPVKAGDTFLAEDNLPKALSAYRDGLALAEHMAKNKVPWQHYVITYRNKIAAVQYIDSDNPSTAFSTFLETLSLAERLVGTEPTNAVWLKDLATTLRCIGMLSEETLSWQKALSYYRRGLEAMLQIAREHKDANDVDCKLEIDWFKTRLAELS